MRLILASSSPYRGAQLRQLGLKFEQRSPGIDETPRPDESPVALVMRLAREKALAIAGKNAEPAVIIAGDQLACLDGQVLGKPLTAARAAAQLRAQSGRRVTFMSALCIHSASGTDCLIEPVHVLFRELDEAAIVNYVDRDQPLDCAGALRSEGLGAALLREIHADDPNALLGIPVFALCRLLPRHGIDVLAPGAAPE